MAFGGGMFFSSEGGFPEGRTRPNSTYGTVRLDGSPGMSLGRIPAAEMWGQAVEGGFTALRLPFGKLTVAAAGPDRFFLGTNESWEIQAFDAQGSLVSRIRTDRSPEEVPAGPRRVVRGGTAPCSASAPGDTCPSGWRTRTTKRTGLRSGHATGTSPSARPSRTTSSSVRTPRATSGCGTRPCPERTPAATPSSTRLDGCWEPCPFRHGSSPSRSGRTTSWAGRRMSWACRPSCCMP